MNISKDKAQKVAKDLLLKKAEQAATLKSKFQDSVYSEVVRHIPKAVKDMEGKHKDYLSYSSSVAIVGNGFNHYHVNTERFITNKTNYSTHTISPDEKVADKLLKSFNAWDKAKKDY